MNILFLEGDMSGRGGTERMTAYLSSALSHDHKVYVVSLSLKCGGSFFKMDDKVEICCFKSEHIRVKMKMIHKFIKLHDIDVIINVDTGMGYIGILTAMGTKAKVVTWEHSNFYNNWNSSLFPYIRRFAARKSNHMVVLTQKDKCNYESNIKKCAPVSVIPNPANKQEFAYDGNAKIILSAGILNKIKRFDLVPEIAKFVFEKHPDWNWIICGDGPEYENLNNKIKSFGLEKSVVLKGSVSDMKSIYKSAAMYIMTSEMEGLPMVLLEAKSFRLPIVSFDIMTGPSDIVRDGVNGFLIESGNTEKMAERVCELIEDNKKRLSFSEASQLDMNKFDPESVVSQWNSLLKSL